VADHDPSKPAKVDLTRVPGLLDQYREQRRAWLAQADELARMREEVRQAAEREALDIVTAARRDVRRIIVEARRELLVLTAQLHAAVEATDAPGIQAPPFTALLADPEARTRLESASQETDFTGTVVHEARRGVRSVLEEARAEIEALTADAPAVFGRGAASPSDTEQNDDEASRGSGRRDEPPGESIGEGPVHELSIDESLAALDFQTRDLPIPTLARLLGNEPDPVSEAPRLSELRSLLRDHVDADPIEPITSSHPVLSPDVEPLATSPFAFDTAPKTHFFADFPVSDPPSNADLAADDADPAQPDAETPRFTPPSRLFAEDETRTSARSARTFVGLFAATGVLAVVGTLWWALGRDSAPLSAATPPLAEKPAGAASAPSGGGTSTAAATTAASPAVAASAPGTIALTIEARRQSWIRAEIDGKGESGRIYQAGETRHIYGAHNVSIRAGDAGAVFVGLDGGTARSLGSDGVAATRQFTATATPAVATVNDRPSASLTTATATSPAPVPTTAAAPVPTTARPAGAEPTASTAAARNAPAVPDGVSGGRPDLVQAAQQWLDAYQRRDRDSMNAMATENVTVSDERSVTERFPAWQGGVQRNLDEVALELTGDVAVFTARMTEHADAGSEHVSRVSQFWQRRSGRWFVTNVRIIGEARLNQIIR
jgi:cytoskeletal protein RodZ